MALFGGSSKKTTMENLMQQLAVHPMLQWVVQVLRQEEQEQHDKRPAGKWKHCTDDYYDDGVRTVFVYRDYLGVLQGKVQQMFPSEEEERKGWKMPANDGFRYTVYGYEPLSGYYGIGYRDVMKAWTEVVRALMMKMYPNYQYSSCAIRDIQVPTATDALHFDESVLCYFTYTLPSPHYEKWFKDQ